MKSLQNKNTERLRGVAISDVCAKGAHILMNNFEGYHYDSVRPITLVHKLFRGRKIRAWGGPFKGTVEMDGKDWMPYQLANSVTPSFPEQVSSLSSFGGAAATILQAFTGSDQFKGCTAIEAGSSAIELGTTPAEDVMLDWPTFTAAAAEARNGRLIQWNPFYKRE